MSGKPTAAELKAYAREAGMLYDFTTVDLLTGERREIPDEQIQGWIDQFWREEEE